MWVEGQSFWYYLITYCFFELVYAMEIIPYETLAAEMSPNYKTKAKFAGARIICGQIANIAAMWLPGVIIAQLGGKESGAHVPLPRRHLLGVLRVRGARRVPVHLGAAARGDRRAFDLRDPADRRSMQSSTSSSMTLGDAAHPRIPPAPRHVPRRLHQPGRPERACCRTSSRSCSWDRSPPPSIDHDVDGVRAARLGGSPRSGSRCASTPRPLPHRARLLRRGHPRASPRSTSRA